MSKKDVLHIPLEGLPPVPEREAGTEDEGHGHHHVPPTFNPDGGPGEDLGGTHAPRIIEPVGHPRSHPGFSVS